MTKHLERLATAVVFAHKELGLRNNALASVSNMSTPRGADVDGDMITVLITSLRANAGEHVWAVFVHRMSRESFRATCVLGGSAIARRNQGSCCTPITKPTVLS
jgi:hypothetical protein